MSDRCRTCGLAPGHLLGCPECAMSDDAFPVPPYKPRPAVAEAHAGIAEGVVADMTGDPFYWQPLEVLTGGPCECGSACEKCTCYGCGEKPDHGTSCVTGY